MSDDALNTDDPTPNDAATATAGVGSIVDSILDLDELLSADVRRARKTARICTKPWLEAELDALSAELVSLTDERGEPLNSPDDDSLAAGRTAAVVAQDYRAMQQEYAAAMRSVIVEAMPEPQWRAWTKANERQLEDLPPELFDDLIVTCAVQPVFTKAHLTQMRERLGHAQVNAIATAAWNVNAKSGVDIPKSSLVSHVLKRQARERN